MQSIVVFDVGPDVKDTAPKSEVDIIDEAIMQKTKWVHSTIVSVVLQYTTEYFYPVIKEIPNVKTLRKNYVAKNSVTDKTNIGTATMFERSLDCYLPSKQKVRIAKNQLVDVVGLKLSNEIYSRNQAPVADNILTAQNIKNNIPIKTGIYSTFSFYKNHYAYAYIIPSFEGCFTSEFVNLDDINLNDCNEVCRTINGLYNRAFIMYNYSAVYKTNDKLSSRVGGFKGQNAISTDWLIKNQIITPGTTRYVNFTVDVNTLLDKMINFNVDKKYVDEIKYMVSVNQGKVNEAIKNKSKLIEINVKRAISFEIFKTDQIHTLNKNQIAEINTIYNKEKGAHTVDKTPNTILCDELIMALASTKRDQFSDVKVLFEKVVAIIDKSSLDKIKKGKEIRSLIKVDKTTFICPHYIDMGYMVVAGQDIVNKNKNLILDRYGIQSYVSNRNINDRDSYCKICGGLLYKYDEEDITFKEKDNYVIEIEDDDIFQMVRKELQFVLNNYVVVTPAKDSSRSVTNQLHKVIDAVSNLIRNKILNVQIDLMKIKTLNDNDMWVLIDIYVYIYIFAVLSQLIFTNSELLSFKYDVGGKRNGIRPKGGAVVTSESKQILDDLLKSKHGKASLERIINFGLELLKKIKYTDIVKSKYITLINIKDLFLSAYKWTLTLNYSVVDAQETSKVASDVNLENYTSLRYFEMHGSLGRDRKQIEHDIVKSIPTYATVKVKDNDVLFDYIVKEKYLEHPVPDNLELEKMYGVFAKAREAEYAANKMYRVAAVRPHIKVPSYETASIAIPNDYIYVKCKCNITYVYKSGKTTHELTKKEVRDIVEGADREKIKEFHKWEFVGSKCVCVKGKESKVVLNFFKYFEQYCPKGELHTKSNGKCTKCGITNDILTNHSTEYYDKWKQTYHKLLKDERDQIDRDITDRLNAKAVAPKRDVEYGVKQFPDWVVQNKDISELAKVFQIKGLYNLISSVGLYENYEYKKLEASTDQPFLNAPPEHLTMQSLTVHNYILYIRQNYYIMKNSEVLLKVPLDLKMLLTKLTQSNKDFAKILTELDDTYLDKYYFYSQKHIAPIELANFTVVSLCRLFLDILDIFKKSGLSKFGSAWCNFYIAKIIGYERYSAKVTLKNLKPLVKYQNDDMDEDTKVEDGDMMDITADGEHDFDGNESGDEQFGLQDVDIEMGSDNEENLYDDKVVEGRD